MLVSSEGIVLKQRKIANNRRMITVFTKNYGKISAGTSLSEKGKTKSALALRPFTYAEYDFFKSRDNFIINSAQVKKSYFSIGEDIDRFLAASKLLDYLDKILEEGYVRTKLFDMTLEFFESITKSTGNYDTLVYAFIIKTLRVQGIMPELNSCVNCGKEVDKFGYQIKTGKMGHCFSIKAGGVICEECINRLSGSSNSLIFKPSFDIIETLRYFINNSLLQFKKISLKPEISKEIAEIINEYISYYLDVDLLRNDVKWR